MTHKDLQKEAKKNLELALAAYNKGEQSSVVNEYYLKAYEYQKQACILFNATSSEEPLRSMLLLDAADLALKAGLYREAEKNVAQALSGDPSEDMANELRNLNQTINFTRHTATHNLQLNPNEIMMTLAGNQVGVGMVKGNEFLERIDTVSKLAYRTADRLRNKPFNEKGKPNRAEFMEFESYLSVPKTDGFGVTIGFGANNKGSFPTLDSQPFLIEDLLNNISLVNEDKITQLSKAIPDEAYRNNFIALTKKLSPDGDKISIVGLSANIHNKSITVPLSKQKSSYNFDFLNKKKAEDDDVAKDVEIIGTLFFADSKKSKIKLFDEYSGHDYLIEVPKGILSDVVRPFFEVEVVVKGSLIKGVIHMVSIDKVD